MSLPVYSTGTVSVAVGGTVVTGTGASWTGVNAKQGDFISIAGADAMLITEVTDATHLKIPPWPGTAKTNVAYVIYQNYVGRVIGVAAAEDVGDMIEKLNTDGLPFIVGPSETVPDPSYGNDGQFAFQPTTGKWWTKTGGAWVASPGLTSDTTKVLKTGDTMTGNLIIDKDWPGIILDKTSGTGAFINGKNNGLDRWLMQIGEGVAETGSNAGSNFSIQRYSDAGSYLGTPLQINRANGNVSVSNDFLCGSVWAAGQLNSTVPNFSYNILLQESSTNWKKGIRVVTGGNLEIINNANTNVIASISDGGMHWSPQGVFGTNTAAWNPSPLVAETIGSGTWAAAVKAVNFGILYLATSSSNVYAHFTQGNTGNQVGQISGTTTGTNYTTVSSIDLKDDLQPFDAGNLIDRIEVHDFKWKATGERAHGVVAQQAQEVYPQAVVHNDAMSYWGIDYSKFVPLLLQEVKELRRRIAALEGEKNPDKVPAT